MNKKQLEKLINWIIKNEDDSISLFPYWWDDYDFSEENLKKFIFETIIPEVLKSVIPNKIWFEEYDECITITRRKVKELYNIKL